MMLALVRRIPEAHAQLNTLSWSRAIHGADSGEAQVNVAVDVARQLVASATATWWSTRSTSPSATRPPWPACDPGWPWPTGGRKTIAGTVFEGQPRVVRLRDLDIEFTPEGFILVLSYEDRPGMVGRIGSILGRLNVNIASMHVGRRSKRGRAIVVLRLDEDLLADQVGEVAAAVEADFARLIRLG